MKILCSFFFLFILTFTVTAQQNGNDSPALRYAEPVYRMIPALYPEYVEQLTDSVFLKNSFIKPGEAAAVFYRKGVCFNEKGSADTCINQVMKVKVDRHHRYKTIDIVNSDSTSEHLEFKWLVSDKASRLIYTSNSGNDNIKDTIDFEYNRAGMVSDVKRNVWIHQLPLNLNAQRLYDYQNKLVVCTGIILGGMKGNLLFTYNTSGDLIRRVFTDSTQSVNISIDTLRYTWLDSLHTKRLIQHDIRLSGTDQWIPVDELTEIAQNKRVLQYKLYIDCPSESRYHLKKGSELNIEYNLNLQPVAEIVSSLNYSQKSVFYLNATGQQDSVITKVRETTAKGKTSEYISSKVIYVRNNKGELTAVSKEIYRAPFAGRKKKKMQLLRYRVQTRIEYATAK